MYTHENSQIELSGFNSLSVFSQNPMRRNRPSFSIAILIFDFHILVQFSIEKMITNMKFRCSSLKGQNKVFIFFNL